METCCIPFASVRRHKDDLGNEIDTIRELVAYVPETVLRRIIADEDPESLPYLESFYGSVLFADISGFTPLCEKFAKSGAAGAEKVRDHLNAYFGRLIPILNDHGLDIVKFAGDALMTVCRAKSEAGLSHAVMLAAAASLKALSQLAVYEAEGVRLTMHIGVGAGLLQGLYVGTNQRREFLLVGEPINQIASAEEDAKAGQVVLSAEAWEHVQRHARGSKLPSGNSHLTAISVGFWGVRKPGKGNVARQLGYSNGPIWCTDVVRDPFWPLRKRVPRPSLVKSLSFLTSRRVHTRDLMERELERYVPETVLLRLHAGQHSKWLAELRTVTVLFALLPGLVYDTYEGLQLVQGAMEAVQATLVQYGGSLRQFIKDDKGSVMIGVFGLATATHEDDPVRCVVTALDIHTKLRKLNLNACMGITTGRAFCGTVGNAKRSEYTVVGDMVNMSARLMAAASRITPPDLLPMLCDEATFNAVSTSVICDTTLEAIRVKGKELPIKIYRPMQSLYRLKGMSNLTPRSGPSKPLVGRSNEAARITAIISNLDTNRTAFSGPGCMVIEGEAGVGKSRLVESCVSDLQAAADSKPLVAVSHAVQTETSTALYVWRRVLATIIHRITSVPCDSEKPERVGGEGSKSGALRFTMVTSLKLRTNNWLQKIKMNRLLTRCQEYGGDRLVELVPLLNTILPLEIPDTAASRAAIVERDAAAASDLLYWVLIQVVVGFSRTRPIVILFEDAQWMDDESWQLALRLNDAKAALLQICCMRPPDTRSASLQRFLRQPSCDRILLDALAEHDIALILCNALDVEEVPQAVVDIIMAKGRGNPLFSLESAYMMRDRRLIHTARRCCIIPQQAAQSSDSLDNGMSGGLDVRLLQSGIPNTVQGVIQSRMDNLPPAEQLVLRVAAVFGLTFSEHMLRDVHPIQADRDNMHHILDSLVHKSLIVADEKHSGRYSFANLMMQEFAYNQLSVNNRRDIHAAIAACYQRELQLFDTFRNKQALVYHSTHAGASSAAPHLSPSTRSRNRAPLMGPTEPSPPASPSSHHSTDAVHEPSTKSSHTESSAPLSVPAAVSAVRSPPQRADGGLRTSPGMFLRRASDILSSVLPTRYSAAVLPPLHPSSRHTSSTPPPPPPPSTVCPRPKARGTTDTSAPPRACKSDPPRRLHAQDLLVEELEDTPLVI